MPKLLSCDDLDTIGKRLRVCRAWKGLQLKDVAEIVGTTAQYLSLLEHDAPGRTPSVHLLQRLGDTYGVTSSQLLGETPLT